MMGGIADRSHSRHRRARLASALLLVPTLARLRLPSRHSSHATRLVSALALALDFAHLSDADGHGACSPPLAGVLGYARGDGAALPALDPLRVRCAAPPTRLHARLFGEFAVTGVARHGHHGHRHRRWRPSWRASRPCRPRSLAAAASFLVVFALRRGVVFSALAKRRARLSALPASLLRPRASAMAWLQARPAGAGAVTSTLTVIELRDVRIGRARLFPVLARAVVLHAVLSTASAARRSAATSSTPGWAAGRRWPKGPAAWFDFRVYNDMSDASSSASRRATSGRIRRTSCCSSGRSGSCPIFRPSFCGRCCGFALFLYVARGRRRRAQALCCSLRSHPPSPSTCSSARMDSSRRALLIGGLSQSRPPACARRRAVRHPHHQAAARPAAAAGAGGDGALANHRRGGGDDRRARGGHRRGSTAPTSGRPISAQRRAGSSISCRSMATACCSCKSRPRSTPVGSSGLPVGLGLGGCRPSSSAVAVAAVDLDVPAPARSRPVDGPADRRHLPRSRRIR